MIKKSDFKHEYLFVLGNGASIASTDPRIKEFIRGNLSIEKFVDVMDEINQNGQKIELQRLIGDSILDTSYNQCIKRIIGISEEKKRPDGKRETNISKLLNSLFYEGRHDDIDKLICTIFITVMAYYKNLYDNYFLKLWKIVRETQSPVVSLNWDINFEKAIYKSTKVDMKNYYGKCSFGHLLPYAQKDPCNPVVDILKPHGSLNWHFLDSIGSQGEINGLVISNQVSIGPWVEEDLHAFSFLIPPLPDQNNNYWGYYKKNVQDIRADIDSRILKIAASTRTLVIIGYSFPDDDEHIKELFTNNRFENVWVFDTNEEVFQRIKCFFSDAKPEFKKGGFADIMNWIPGEVATVLKVKYFL
jgi:hypothetical protein